MTGSALMGYLGHELILLDLLDLMGRMTIFTRRQFFLLVRPGYVVNALCVLVVDAFVAGSTCGGEVFVIGRRTFVIVLELQVGRVAVRAYGAGKESLFNKALSVYAAGVVDHSVSCGCFDKGGLIDFAVTIAA